MIATLATSQNWKKKPWLTPCYLLVIGIALISALGSAEYCTHFFDQNLIRQCLLGQQTIKQLSKNPLQLKLKRNEFLRKKIGKQMDRIQECKEVTENITGKGPHPPQPPHTVKMKNILISITHVY